MRYSLRFTCLLSHLILHAETYGMLGTGGEFRVCRASIRLL